MKFATPQSFAAILGLTLIALCGSALGDSGVIIHEKKCIINPDLAYPFKGDVFGNLFAEIKCIDPSGSADYYPEAEIPNERIRALLSKAAENQKNFGMAITDIGEKIVSVKVEE